MKKEKSQYIIKSVFHALQLLEQFCGSEDELGVSELSKRMRLHKNNVFRLLATLESCNYVEQDKRTDSYRLGLKSMEFGRVVLRQMRLQRVSKPVMESLVSECNETCFLSILKGDHMMYLDAIESVHSVRIVPCVGIMLPACCTAAGKVMLAGLPEMAEGGFSVAGRFTKFVDDCIGFNRQLDKIATQGYALEDEESDAGVREVAAPIRDYSQAVVGAVSIAGPVMRFSEARIHDELVPLVLRGAAEISRRLGYSVLDDLSRVA